MYSAGTSGAGGTGHQRTESVAVFISYFYLGGTSVLSWGPAPFARQAGHAEQGEQPFCKVLWGRCLPASCSLLLCACALRR